MWKWASPKICRALAAPFHVQADVDIRRSCRCRRASAPPPHRQLGGRGRPWPWRRDHQLARPAAVIEQLLRLHHRRAGDLDLRIEMRGAVLQRLEFADQLAELLARPEVVERVVARPARPIPSSSGRHAGPAERSSVASSAAAPPSTKPITASASTFTALSACTRAALRVSTMTVRSISTPAAFGSTRNRVTPPSLSAPRPPACRRHGRPAQSAWRRSAEAVARCSATVIDRARGVLGALVDRQRDDAPRPPQSAAAGRLLSALDAAGAATWRQHRRSAERRRRVGQRAACPGSPRMPAPACAKSAGRHVARTRGSGSQPSARPCGAAGSHGCPRDHAYRPLFAQRSLTGRLSRTRKSFAPNRPASLPSCPG